MKILVTGGAGFIGSALTRHLIRELKYEVLCLDKLSYASSLDSLEEVKNNPLFSFEKQDICNESAVFETLNNFKPNVIINLAAETHVDRSIDDPESFVLSNIFGTFSILQASLKYWQSIKDLDKEIFRFHHVSTDEVFGDLKKNEAPFSELTPYDPSSPYSASKASSDHLVRSWYRTYGLPVLLSNCSNNYGPFQFTEKLIPLVITKALKGESLPIYGKGDQVRDWLFVEDHVKALVDIFQNGKIGESYNVGGNCEKTNLEVVKEICSVLDGLVKTLPSRFTKHEELIQFVEDRPGHDQRYAIDSSKIQRELNWNPEESFKTGIKKTVKWYFENKKDHNYSSDRLGLGVKK